MKSIDAQRVSTVGLERVLTIASASGRRRRPQGLGSLRGCRWWRPWAGYRARRLWVKEGRYDEMLTNVSRRQIARFGAAGMSAFSRVFRHHRDNFAYFGYELLAPGWRVPGSKGALPV